MPAITMLSHLDAHMRLVTAALAARVLPGQSTEDLLDRMDQVTPGQRRVWMSSTMAILFAFALVAAQFGVWGLAAYFAAIVIAIR